MTHTRIRTLASLGLLAGLAMSINASAQTPCQCGLTTLMGTQAKIHYGNFPSNTDWNGTVTTGIEVPSIPGTTPPWQNPQRFNIDLQNSKIRVEFARDASYGFGAQFTFTLAPLAPAPCGAATIVGSSVKTNRSDAKPHVTAQLFTANTVTIVFDNVTFPPGGPRAFPDWKKGDWIEAQLSFACGDNTTPTTDPCCPPLNTTNLGQMLVYQGTGGILDPYTLNFTPSSAFNAQMQAYINYLNTVNPAITTITINFALRNAGTGTTAVPIGAPLQTASLTWAFNGGPPVSTFFGPGLMLVNKWYRVETTIGLNDNIEYFPKNCINKFVDVRLQVALARLAPKPGSPLAAGEAILEMRLPDGSTLEKPIKQKQR